ncbi:site-specific DNA-methyltransferase [Mycoplasma sp. 4423]
MDPPYNTERSASDGNNVADDTENKKNKTLIYRDKYTRNGWLNMMNERLRMARELLKDDGVIFVSIDDNQQAYLKILMDEIFGENNFVANFIWRNKNTGGGSDKNKLEIENEYVVCYAKNNDKVVWNLKEIDTKKYKLKDEFFDTRGGYYLTDLDRSCSETSFKYSESLDYEIMAPDQSLFKNHRNIKEPRSYAYTWGLNLFNYGKENGFIVIKQIKDKSGQNYWRAYRKSYEKVQIDREGLKIIPKEGRNFTNLIIDGSITTSAGKRLLISILENKSFSFPKPIQLITYLINQHPNKNSRVLDFYAGSGTTGHAVLELNRKDGGNRTFTLVTNNENNIGININYQRLRRINTDEGLDNNKYNLAWYKKNNPYNSNLNVYWLDSQDYINIGLESNETIEEIENKWVNLIKNFGVQETNFDKDDLLTELLTLKPLIKDGKN